MACIAFVGWRAAAFKIALSVSSYSGVLLIGIRSVLGLFVIGIRSVVAFVTHIYVLSCVRFLELALDFIHNVNCLAWLQVPPGGMSIDFVYVQDHIVLIFPVIL